MARKTYAVSDLRDKVNRMIAHSHKNDDPDTAPFGSVIGRANRTALFVLLESVLHDTDNYRGFQYLDGADAVRADRYDDTARKYN
jgi:hypothetical protein